MSLALGFVGIEPHLEAQAPGPADALLQAAERRARDGDLAGALDDYEQLIRQFPDSAQAPLALLRMAEGQLAAGDRSAAFSTVERLVTSYPRAPEAAGGLLLEGRLRSGQPNELADLEGARKTLEKAWLLFPRTVYPVLEWRSGARVLDGEIALRLQQDEEATSSFLTVIESEPSSAATADAHIGLAAALVRDGAWQAAAESLTEALAIPGASAQTLALATRRLALLERRFLRGTSGNLWQRARTVALSGAKRVSGVAALDDGRLLVFDSGADQLLERSSSGALGPRVSVRNGERPSWGPEASVQLAARDAGLLPGQAHLNFKVPGKEKPLDGIRAMERDPFGRWVILAGRSNGVLTYDANRRSGRPVLRGDGDPVDLDTDALDHLYILERKARRVLRINQQNDQRATAVQGTWKKADAVTVDAYGFIHVLDADSNRIYSYDAAGDEIGAVGPVLPGNIELRNPEDLAVSGDGRLFIADSRLGLIVLE